MRTLETALTVILAAAMPAVAQQTTQQAQPRAASQASAEGVDQMSSSAFSRWDANGDQRLRGEEFAAGLHEAWAGDTDRVDETAFNENWNNWFNADRPDFSDLDEDGNGELSEHELRLALADADLSGPWQGADDGYLTPEEFRSGINTVADRDRDGQLNQSEMDNVVAVIGVLVPDPSSTAATNRQTSGQQAQNMSQNMSGQSGQAGQTDMSGNPSNITVGEIIALNDWDTDALYRNSWSAEALFDRQVFSRDGEEIGDVEDLIIGSDGQLLALIAEVGGFWDIGDTHVSIPWNQVTFRQDGTVAIPVTEENADDFSVLNEPTGNALEQGVVSNLDGQELGPRAWRASELIGDIARIRNDRSSEGAGGGEAVGQQAATPEAGQVQANQGQAGQPMTGSATATRTAYRGYGYVSDLIFSEGRVAAAIVDRDAGYGTRGRYPYPYYGYNYGWAPGNRYYDLPYNQEDAVTITPFDYERLNEG